MSKKKIKPNNEPEEFYFNDDDLIVIDDCFNTNLPAEHKQNLTKLFSKLTVAPFGEIFATPFNNEKTLITYAKLDYVNSGVTFNGKFDETHELILNSLYSFYRAENILFTSRNILQHIFGNVPDHFQSEIVEVIEQHLDELRCMRISMDLKDKFGNNAFIKLRGEKYRPIALNEDILDVSILEMKSAKNSKVVKVYRINRLSPIFKYAEKLKQITSWQTEFMKVPVRKTMQNALLCNYLLTKISLVKNSKNKYKNNGILFSTIHEDLKLDVSDRHKVKNIRDNIRKMFDYWIKIGLIKSYHFEKKRDGILQNFLHCRFRQHQGRQAKLIRDNIDYIHAHPEIYFTQEAKKGGYVCPVCGNGSGSDGTGVKLIKGQTFRYKCFKCDTSGDVINFYAAEHNLSNIEAIAQVCALYGLEIPKKKFKRISPTHKRISSNEKPLEKSKNPAEIEVIAKDILLAASHLRETDYFIKRGISYETAEKYNCGYIAEWIHPTKRSEKNIYPSPRVIIPTSRESYVARSTDDNKIPKMKAGTGNIFNIDILKSSRQHVVVVEGEFDALSIIEAGNDAIALGSTSNVDKLINWLKEKNVQPHLPLLLNLDADEAGQNATDKLAATFRDIRIKFYEVNLIIEGCKDQNESLVNFRNDFFQLVADIPNKVSQLQQQARFKLTDFAKIDTWEKNIHNGRKAISTGWDSLDKTLDGGLYEGLYVIPGTPGTGKTALALQMTFQIAQQKQDVLYISMEMGEEEIYERHISRISYQLFWHDKKNRHKAKTVHSMIQEGKTVTQAKEIFKKVAPYLRTECSVGTIDADDIRRIVEIYKYELNSLPVVFIDYLQILKAHDAHMTDKQAVDYNVLRLKQLSRDFKIPVVILSSMNRVSYSDVISMAALKESGAIEYTADVCLGLQHANMEQIKTGTSTGKAEKTIRQMKGKSERDMEIIVLKNRNGKIGEELSFSYYAMFHHFRCLSKEIYESNNANNIFEDTETTNNHTNWI